MQKPNIYICSLCYGSFIYNVVSLVADAGHSALCVQRGTAVLREVAAGVHLATRPESCEAHPRSCRPQDLPQAISDQHFFLWFFVFYIL